MREPYESYFHHLRELHNMIKRAAEGLPAEGLDWAPAPETNSLAVLMVHVAGAERHWIGEIVGRQPIDRNRSAEFETAGLGQAELERHLDDALELSRRVLERLVLQDLTQLRQLPPQGREVSVAWALAHALDHTAQHAGHAELTRQLWDQRQG